jgi:hypothetical protein
MQRAAGSTLATPVARLSRERRRRKYRVDARPDGADRIGRCRDITIYANSAHAWIVIVGIALDTADYGGPAIPAGSGPRWRTEPLANLTDGTSYVARHPPGL